MAVRSSVHQQLKLDESCVVVVIVLDILGPQFAHNVDKNSVDGVVEFHHDQWRPVALLNEERKVVEGKSAPGFVRDHSDVLFVSSVLK